MTTTNRPQPGARVRVPSCYGATLYVGAGQTIGVVRGEPIGEVVAADLGVRLADWIVVAIDPAAVEPGNDGCAATIAEEKPERLYVAMHEDDAAERVVR